MMWLDRLGHTVAGSPQAGSRPASPLPRRTSSTRSPYVTSQRSARGSSQSLVSNESTNSLLASARRPNGSTLKQTTTIDDGKDAIVALEKLVGSQVENGSLEKYEGALITEDDLNLEFDFQGLSLRELVQRSTADGVDKLQTAEECTTSTV